MYPMRSACLHRPRTDFIDFDWVFVGSDQLLSSPRAAFATLRVKVKVAVARFVRGSIRTTVLRLAIVQTALCSTTKFWQVQPPSP